MNFKDDLTQETACKLLSYNPETGDLRWKTSRRGYKAGALAGCLSRGYIVVRINRSLYMAHRVIWLMTQGKWPDPCIDHVNGNRNDNRLCNLREASHSENQFNIKCRIDNTSGIKGVSWLKARRRWLAVLTVKGKHKHIGQFQTITEAKIAIQQARNLLHREFANNG